MNPVSYYFILSKINLKSNKYIVLKIVFLYLLTVYANLIRKG